MHRKLVELLATVILKSLVRFAHFVAWIHHVLLAVRLHMTSTLNRIVEPLYVHVVWHVLVHPDDLLSLHLHLLLVSIGMHSLWRVKVIWVNLLIVLTHLIWHSAHSLVHTHVLLIRHALVDVVHAHLLIVQAWLLHLMRMRVLNSLLVGLHLINTFMIMIL